MKFIEKIKELEEKRICPRCGEEMNEVLERNALSRHENIHICNECGEEEALLDWICVVQSQDGWYASELL